MANSIFTFTNTDTITFNGKNFVLTGFGAADEKELTLEILSRGGRVRSSLVLATDYLIVNEYFDHQSVKYKKAVELNAAGKNIAIISRSMYEELCKNAGLEEAAKTETADGAAEKSAAEKPVKVKKEIRSLSAIPTRSGSLEFDKVAFAFLGITGKEKASLTAMIEAKGGVVGNPGKKTQYLIYNPEKAKTMKFWQSALEREVEDSIYLMTPELFLIWSDPEYQISRQKFDKQLEVCMHFLTHPDDWEQDAFCRKGDIENILLSEAGKIVDTLAKSEETADELAVYFGWGHKFEKGKWFGKVKPEKMSAKGAAALIVDYLTKTDAWDQAGMKVKDDLEGYMISDSAYFLNNLYLAQNYESLGLYFDFLAAKEKNWTESGYSDGFYVYSLVSRYADKAIEDKNLEATSLFLDYKASHFDELFMEEADSNELDIELGLKSRPAVYYMKGETLKFGMFVKNGAEDGIAEPIEWRVLAQEDGKALIISKDILAEKEYNETLKSMTWEKCTLRKWLDKEFYDIAFNAEEKSRIIPVTNTNPDNEEQQTKGGNDTDDKVFLLSIDEVNQYFRDDTDRATGNGWWLRSPGYGQRNAARAARVDRGGDVHDVGYFVSLAYGVRPALWLDLSNPKS